MVDEIKLMELGYVFYWSRQAWVHPEYDSYTQYGYDSMDKLVPIGPEGVAGEKGPSGPKGPTESKYTRTIQGSCESLVDVDVYDVLKAFNVTCPALQHLIKKALCTGLRGHKDKSEDLKDIVDSAIRAQQLGDK